MAEESPDPIGSFFKGLYNAVKRDNPALVEPLENLVEAASSAYSTFNSDDATASEVVGACTQLVGTAVAAGTQIDQALESGLVFRSKPEITDENSVAANFIAAFIKYEPLFRAVADPYAPREDSLMQGRLVDFAADACAILRQFSIMKESQLMDEFLQNRREELIEANNGNDGDLHQLLRSYVMKVLSYHVGHNYFGPVGAGAVGAATAGLIDFIRSFSESGGASGKQVALDETSFADFTQKAIAYALEGRIEALKVERWYFQNEIRALHEVIKIRLSFDKGNQPIRGHEVWTVLLHNATGKFYFGVNQNARQHFKESKGERGKAKGNAYVQLTEPDEPLPVGREAETCAEMHAFAQLLVDQQLLKTVFEAVQQAKFIDKKTKDALKDIENMSKLQLRGASSDADDSAASKRNEGKKKKISANKCVDEETLATSQSTEAPEPSNGEGNNKGNNAAPNKLMREQPREIGFSWQRFEFRVDPADETVHGNPDNKSSKSKPDDGRPRGRQLLHRLMFASFFLSSPVDKLVNDPENLKKLMDPLERKTLLKPIFKSKDVFERDRAHLLNELLQDESGKQILRKKKKSFDEFITHSAVIAFCNGRSDADLLNEIAGVDLTNTTIYTFARKEDGSWTNRGRCGNCRARDSLMGKVTTDPSVPGLDVPDFPDHYYYGPLESEMYETMTIIRPPDYYGEERVIMTNEQYERKVREFTEESRRLIRGNQSESASSTEESE